MSANDHGRYGQSEVPPRWESRFAFYDAYGKPADPSARAVFKALPLGRQMRITFNVLAFFFGPIYFAVKGMWRKGLALLGMNVAVAVVLVMIDAPPVWSTAVGAGFAGLAASTANYAYYLHIRAESRSWNLFEGMARTKTA